MNVGAMMAADNFEFDYMFTIDEDCDIENVDVIQDLLVLNKKVVSPLLTDSQSVYSNIWPCDKNNLHNIYDSLSMLDYRYILDRTLTGCWIVPFVDKCLLIHKDLMDEIGDFYTKNQEADIINELETTIPKKSIIFCANMLDSGIFMHVDNQKTHGHLLV